MIGTIFNYAMVAIFLLFPFVYAAVFLVGCTIPYVRLRFGSASTEGSIDSLVESEYEGYDEYYVHKAFYSFPVTDKGTVKGSSQLSGKGFHALRVGQRVRIRYLPAAPQKNRLADHRPREALKDAFFWPLFFLLMEAILALAVSGVLGRIFAKL